jgi:hypothetical protein
MRLFSVCVCLVLGFSFSLAGVNDGLVAHWEFENNFNDSTANGNDGTGFGDVTYADGRFGQAASFDGTGDYIKFPNDASFQFGGGDFSVSVWVKPNSSINNGRVIDTRGTGSSQAGWVLKLDDNGSDWEIYQSGMDDGTKFPKCDGCGDTYSTDGWHHIVMVYTDDSTMKYYVNGQLDGTTNTGTMGSADNTLSLSIGAAIASSGVEGATAQFFNGLIDEVRVYDRALLENEITELFGDQIFADRTLNVPTEYATVQAALDSLDDKRIDKNAVVTIQVGNGTYTNYDTIEFTHIDGERIHLIGNITTPANCKIQFATGMHGILVQNGYVAGKVAGFTLEAGTSPGNGVYVYRDGTILALEDMVITDFDTGLRSAVNSLVEGDSVTVQDSTTYGILAIQESSINLNNSSSTGNTLHGVMSSQGSTVVYDNGTASNNTKHGLIAQWHSLLIAEGCTVQNNGLYGCFAGLGGYLDIRSSTVSGNTSGSYSPSANSSGNQNSYIYQQ